MTPSIDTLSCLPAYQNLDHAVQNILRQLVQDNRLNEYGCLKRPPNVWLLFRSDVLATIDDVGVTQTEVTARSKSAWNQTTPEQREKLKERAKLKSSELLQLFPDYQYRPLNAEERYIWSQMSSHKRKEFWLAAAVRIATRIAYPHEEWEGLLSLAKWFKGNPVSNLAGVEGIHTLGSAPAVAQSEHTSRASSRVAHRAERGAGSNSEPQCVIPVRPSRATHPYRNAGRRPVSIESNFVPDDFEADPPEWLRSVLVYIGPSQGLCRRLVLSTFQSANQVIWVEEEVSPDFPSESYRESAQRVSNGESSRTLIIRNYSNPRIPAAIDEDGEPYLPTLREIPEFCQYILEYQNSAAAGCPFTWNGRTLRGDTEEIQASMSPATSRVPSLTTSPTNDNPASYYSPTAPVYEFSSQALDPSSGGQPGASTPDTQSDDAQCPNGSALLEPQNTFGSGLRHLNQPTLSDSANSNSSPTLTTTSALLQARSLDISNPESDTDLVNPTRWSYALTTATLFEE